MRPEALILALAIAAAGCAPKIEGFHLSEGVEGQPVVARAEISGGGDSLLEPELRFLELTSGNGTLGNTIPMRATSEESWTGQIDGLTYGQYEIRLRVPYESTWGVTSKRETALLWVRPRPESFAFDDRSTGLAGWTLDGTYDGGTATQVKPDGAATLALAWSPIQWPTLPGAEESGPAGGSLTVDLPAGSVPADAAATPSGWWRVDFVSPDLTGNQAWQGLTEISLRVMAGFEVSVQPAIVYRTADGTVNTVVPLDPEDDDLFFFELRPNRWEAITAAPIVPTGAEVIQVRVRVFGLATSGAPGSVWLDSVCPIGE